MRAILNISLPQQMVSVVEEHIASGKYASKSEFFRTLLRAWMENQLLVEVRKSQTEYKAGKGKLLKSLKDLE